MAFTIATLLDAGLLHRGVRTVAGSDLGAYALEPKMDGDKLVWHDVPAASLDRAILRSAFDPFQRDGCIRLVTGNLGRAMFKTSAVEPSRWTIEASCRISGTYPPLRDVIRSVSTGALAGRPSNARGWWVNRVQRG